MSRTFAAFAVAVAATAWSGCSQSEPAPAFRSIEPVCVQEVPADDAIAWECSEPLSVECSEPMPEHIYVIADEPVCDAWDLEDIDGPFGPGTHEIVVVDAVDGEAVCSTTLEVRDEYPPEITTRDLELWPPNHKMHSIALDDCIETIDDCDPDVTTRLLWVSSDEADDDRGDGHTTDDVADLAPDGVSLRSERDGRGDGRVYTLGFEAEDSSGNVTEAECRVIVPHDRGGKESIDSGEAYRIDVPE